MDLKTTKEPVFLGEVVYDGQIEQGIEFDYVLPDYFPDIFKVLKCSVTPCVISYSVSGTQLFCDGAAYIKVLYLSRESNRINCVEQRYTYSKTVDLVKPAENALVRITPKTDYCNCRAISGRRLDVRGAISCKVKVSCTREFEMITGASGMGAETRKSVLSYCGEKLIASRRFVTREDIETGAGGLGISNIIHHDASVSVTDYKVIANKIIIKGEASIKALYSVRKSVITAGAVLDNSENAENAPAETQSEETEVMEASVPISQIIDINGVTEKHLCYVSMNVMDCSLEVKPGDGGENRVISCDLTVNCAVAAHLEKEVMPITDMYSTDFESSFTKTVIKTETMPQIIDRQLNIKGTVECADGNLESVADSRCEISNAVCRARGDSELVITGQANYQVIGRLESGVPVFLEKTEQFELTAEASGLTEEHIIEPNLQVVNTTYGISSDNKVDVRAVLKFSGCLYRINSAEVIKDIAVNSDAPKQKDSDYALKLYYAEEGEDVWNIAKRYNTGADAIIAENDMESDRVNSPCMLLIPM